MKKHIAILPGDGIGPEVMTQTLRVLETIAYKYGHEFIVSKGLIGGAAYDEYNSHFPEETKRLCEHSDAILFGAVGGPVAEQHLDPGEKIEVKQVSFSDFIEMTSSEDFGNNMFTNDILRMKLDEKKLDEFKKKLFR